MPVEVDMLKTEGVEGERCDKQLQGAIRPRRHARSLVGRILPCGELKSVLKAIFNHVQDRIMR